MSEFLTRGLENDRYQTARQLIKEFEKELVVELRTIGQQMVDENRELFDTPVEGSKSTSSLSNSLPFARVDYPMNRIQSREDNTELILNVHLYWCDPRDYNRGDIDGVLRALGYKIKNIAAMDEDTVVSKTRDWPIQTAENRFGGETAFYRHVSSADEIEEAGEQLVEHFSAFGEEYGIPRT